MMRMILKVRYFSWTHSGDLGSVGGEVDPTKGHRVVLSYVQSDRVRTHDGRTYADPCKRHLIRDLFRLRQQTRVSLLTELVCAEEASEIANGSLENTEDSGMKVCVSKGWEDCVPDIVGCLRLAKVDPS